MKNFSFKSLALFVLLVGTFSIYAQTQTAPPWPGKYEGTGKGPKGDVQMSLELLNDAGKFSGRITTANSVYEVVSGQVKDGLLSLTLDSKGSAARLEVSLKDDKLVGELLADGKKGPVEFHRVTKDELSGVWEGTADAQGQPFPFTLTLKLDGEKVTGGSSSQLGEASITSGTWKDGKLNILLDGQIAMAAEIIEGKLVGDYDYAGQSQGKWAAIKKKQ